MDTKVIIATAIFEKLGIDTGKNEDAFLGVIDLLKKEINLDSITVTWNCDDVQSAYEEFLETAQPSYEQKLEVLKRCKVNHDANEGITWDVLRYHLNKVMNEV